jgi:hypothetical protein
VTTSPRPTSPAGPAETRPQRAAGTSVDPRGQRFAAAITSVVLAVVVLTHSASLLAVQAAVFGVGAFLGVRRSPYSVVFARLVRPRIGPPTEVEDARPPQFAQLVGLVFAVVGLVVFWTGLTVLGLVATGLALLAALLNAVIGLCLGCELYLTLIRLTHTLSPGRDRDPATTTEVSA